MLNAYKQLILWQGDRTSSAITISGMFLGIFMVYGGVYYFFGQIELTLKQPAFFQNDLFYTRISNISNGHDLHDKNVYSSKNHSAKSKKILIWTGCFKKDSYCGLYASGRKPFLKFECPVSTCEVTEDRKQIADADAVVFYSRSTSLKRLPQIRTPHQRYIFYNHEASVGKNLGTLKNFFNMTITYRPDSDVQFLHVNYNQRSRPPWSGSHVPEYSPLANGQEIINKRMPIAWMVSNCHTSSQREFYARELSKYIKVDIYGACGSYHCRKGPMSDLYSECMQMIGEKYNFYLSFENSICPNYVTEKVEKALRINTVPIVYGGGNYSDITPPNSVINIEDFPNPKDLAVYLKDLLSSYEKYSKYLEWKKDYYIPEEIHDKYFWCDVCKLLNDEYYPPKVYHNILDWWGTSGTDKNCVRGKMRDLKTRGNWGH